MRHYNILPTIQIKNGESVTVKGTIGKQTIGVIDMTDCEVVK